MVSEFGAALRANRLVAILRGNNCAATVDAAGVLLDEGMRLLEVSLSGHDALRAIRTVAAVASADAWIGADTVLTREQARQAAQAGARFIVTPVCVRRSPRPHSWDWR